MGRAMGGDTPLFRPRVVIGVTVYVWCRKWDRCVPWLFVICLLCLQGSLGSWGTGSVFEGEVWARGKKGKTVHREKKPTGCSAERERFILTWEWAGRLRGSPGRSPMSDSTKFQGRLAPAGHRRAFCYGMVSYHIICWFYRSAQEVCSIHQRGPNNWVQNSPVGLLPV